jgi:hypothetical protein
MDRPVALEGPYAGDCVIAAQDDRQGAALQSVISFRLGSPTISELAPPNAQWTAAPHNAMLLSRGTGTAPHEPWTLAGAI